MEIAGTLTLSESELGASSVAFDAHGRLWALGWNKRLYRWDEPAKGGEAEWVRVRGAIGSGNVVVSPSGDEQIVFSSTGTVGESEQLQFFTPDGNWTSDKLAPTRNVTDVAFLADGKAAVCYSDGRTVISQVRQQNQYACVEGTAICDFPPMLFDRLGGTERFATGTADGRVILHRIDSWRLNWLLTGPLLLAALAMFVVGRRLRRARVDNGGAAAESRPDQPGGVHAGERHEERASELDVAQPQSVATDGLAGQSPPSPRPPIDFVIITPLAEERDALLARLPGHYRLPPCDEDIRVYYAAELRITFPGGTTGAYSIIVMPLAKMGHTEAATATAQAVHRWKPLSVLLVGIAGGMAQAGVRLGDVLIADQVADYEVAKVTTDGAEIRWQVHRVDERLLIAAQNYVGAGWQQTKARRCDRRRPTVHYGPICTGNKVVADQSLAQQFREVWGKLIGVEMEASGVANSAAQSAGQPGFFMVRGVSDLADGDKESAPVKRSAPLRLRNRSRLDHRVPEEWPCPGGRSFTWPNGTSPCSIGACVRCCTWCDTAGRRDTAYAKNSDRWFQASGLVRSGGSGPVRECLSGIGQGRGEDRLRYRAGIER